jgi:transposase
MLLHGGNFCTLTSFVTLWMASEGNAPKSRRINSWFLFRDNASTHRSVLVKDFLAKSNVTTLKRPPYSSDVTAAEFYLFPLLKSAVTERSSCDSTGIKNATEELKRFPQYGFMKCE